ncbi:EamA-like transporter family protein [Pseudomonas sp. NFACC15-1]|uniref:DMT family transporter n=1 Tax=unclassified Pseudomonas TaxID=196821 RepID=UPI00088D4C18|nr:MULTISPECIES: DMT family transporter [unclassified Pseudomonas]SDA76735.1 EamA-like transporter family protein [Pseudomonas sp. NFACC15-1]SDY32692.1 EamA-like transporter family protein [Pseudomonas sp. NFACC14]
MALSVAGEATGLHSRLGFAVTILASTFLMGSSFVSGKILLEQGFDPLMLVGWRFFLAALATLPLVFMQGGSWRANLLPRHLDARQVLVIAIIGLTQTTAVMSLLFLAMRTVSASTAAILLFTNPVWVAVGNRLFFAQPLKANRLLGLVTGLIGVALAIGADFAKDPQPGAWIGVTLGLGAAVSWATATLIIKRNPVAVGTWTLSFWQLFIGALGALACALLAGEHWPDHLSIQQWGWFAWLAIPASTGSFGLWFVALKQADATSTSGWLFLAPMFAVLLSWAVLDIQLSAWQCLGGLLVAASIWLMNR